MSRHPFLDKKWSINRWQNKRVPVFKIQVTFKEEWQSLFHDPLNALFSVQTLQKRHMPQMNSLWFVLKITKGPSIVEQMPCYLRRLCNRCLFEEFGPAQWGH